MDEISSTEGKIYLGWKEGELDVEADEFGLTMGALDCIPWEWILQALAEVRPTPTSSDKIVNSNRACSDPVRVNPT